MKVLICHVDPNFIRNFIEIPSNSLFISSRMTRVKILNTVDSRKLEPSREIEKGSSYREFEENNRE